MSTDCGENYGFNKCKLNGFLLGLTFLDGWIDR